ncbi:MAG: SDR family oxidoreductase, partial [Natronomonas sp.]|uniref:SDR family oxidoreductase n=1 Tax=Natronomonas sp. TaxID=2184060 RepID=UPI00287074F0
MTDLFDLSEKVAVVTGGGGLIGEQVCRRLADQGATVVVVDTDTDSGERLAVDVGANAHFRAFDVTDGRSIEEMITWTADEFGSLDVLVNAAYPRQDGYSGRYENLVLEDWWTNVDLHLTSYFYASYCASRVMMDQDTGGSIVNLGSIYGVQGPDFTVYEGTGITNSVEYAAIKGGIINLVRYMASYLGEHGVRVNAVSPGGVFDGQDETFVDSYEQRTPLGRMANPDDVAGPVVFLAADASAYVTGHNLVVDGGWTIR